MTGQENNNPGDRRVATRARQAFDAAVDSIDAGVGNRLRLMRREALAGPRAAKAGWLVPSIAIAAAILAVGLAWRQPALPTDPSTAAIAVDEAAPLGFPSDDEVELYAWLGEAPVATPAGESL